MQTSLISLVMQSKITLDEWLDIVSEVVTELEKRFSDDGKISISDGIALLLVLVRGIAKAQKN